MTSSIIHRARALLLILIAQGLHAQELQWLQAIKSGASLAEQAHACQQLGLVGDESCIETLALRLSHPQLVTYARSAIEQIGGTKAEKSLAAAFQSASMKNRVGLLQSLARLEAEETAALATSLLSSESLDRDSMAVVASAFAQVAMPKDLDLLIPIIAERDEAEQRVLMDALLQTKAIEYWNAERVERLQSSLKSDALKQLAETLTGNMDRLAEGLESQDSDRFVIALNSVVRAANSTTIPTLRKALKTVPTERKASLLRALGTTDTQEVVPLLANYAMDADPSIALAAVQSLAQLGQSETGGMPMLAYAPNEWGAQALASIAAQNNTLLDEETNFVLGRGLRTPEVWNEKLLLNFIQFAAKRRNAAATKTLLRYAEHNSESVRHRAIAALGSTVPSSEFGKLLNRIITDRRPGETTSIQECLDRACLQLPQGPTAIEIGKRLKKADPETAKLLLNTLVTLGGTEALNLVVDAARGQDDSLTDAATAALGNWLTSDAGSSLLDLSKSLDSSKYKLRTLRGAIRIARQLDMPIEERMILCERALSLASRDDEKLLVLDALARHPDLKGLQLADELAAQTSLRNRSHGVIIRICERLQSQFPNETRFALVQLGKDVKNPALRAQIETLLEQ